MRGKKDDVKHKKKVKKKKKKKKNTSPIKLDHVIVIGLGLRIVFNVLGLGLGKA